MDIRKVYIQLFQIVKRKKRAILFSLSNMFILLILSYFLNNQPLFTGEDLNQYAWMEWIKDKCGLSKDFEEKDDALFVNVGYDKQLIERLDNYGMPVGNADITDRTKLLSFLEMLKKTDAYKFVFLDVRFEKGFESPVDSALFSLIKKMRNIVVASHSDIVLADSTLLSKAALNDYSTTIIESNFTRYEYLKNKKISVPLFAYRELTGNTIDRHFLFYTCNHKLCYKTLFIHAPIEDWSEFNEEQTKMYYNLGNDILGNYTDNEISLLTKGKYVVIGDMVEDMHDTYSGEKPGSVITYYAFLALMKGEHYVKYGLWAFLGLFYFLISLSLFEPNTYIERIPYLKNVHSKFFHFCLSFLGYSFMLLIVMIFINMLFGIATSIMLPSIDFALIKTWMNYKKETI